QAEQRDENRDTLSAGNAHHVGSGRLALQTNDSREHVEEWKEVREYTHTDKKIVCTFHRRSCLTQENEYRREYRLNRKRHVRRTPPRMYAAECRGKEFVDTGDER